MGDAPVKLAASGFFVYLTALGAGYIVFGAVHAAQRVVPFPYWGFPWDMVLFGGFFIASIWKYGWKGFFLGSFTYCSWELIDIVWHNPLEVVYLGMFAVSLILLGSEFFRFSWKALSVLLIYRVGSAGYAWQLAYTGPLMACGYQLCPGTQVLPFALGQIIYTLFVFGWVNESLGDPLLPKLGEYFRRVSPEAEGPGDGREI